MITGEECKKVGFECVDGSFCTLQSWISGSTSWNSAPHVLVMASLKTELTLLSIICMVSLWFVSETLHDGLIGSNAVFAIFALE